MKADSPVKLNVDAQCFVNTEQGRGNYVLVNVSSGQCRGQLWEGYQGVLTSV